MYPRILSILFLLLFTFIAGTRPLPVHAAPESLIQEYATPLRKTPPLEIATGPDRSVWFTQRNVNTITHFMPDTGAFKVYHTFFSTSFPESIATDRSGDLWFSAAARYVPNPPATPALIGRISSKTGAITIYHPLTFQDVPQALTLGSDGSIWYVTRESIGRVTPEGNVAEFSLSRSELFWGIHSLTAGPDGNMWFVAGEGRLVSITPLGHFAFYNLTGSSLGCSSAMVTGSDGNFWCMDRANTLYRITPQGNVTSFAVPSAYDTTSNLLVAGANGRFWFIDGRGNQLVVATLQGTFTAYQIPTTASRPGDIARASDGALWFSETAAYQIGRFALPEEPVVSGGKQVKAQTLFQEFVVPAQNITPLVLAPGTDGTLWFTELQTSNIGGITTTGVLRSQYQTPQNYSVYGQLSELVQGRDGALWFPYEWSNIARLSEDGTIMQINTDQSHQFYSFSPNPVDGNIWFLSGPYSYGYITPQGKIHEVGIPHNSRAYNANDIRHLVAATDGNLWIVEPSANLIGHLSRHGQISEFAIPQGGSHATLIVAGTNGSAWFLETNGNRIGHVTSDGHFQEFPLHVPLSDVLAMTLGPDSNIWLGADNTLVRVLPDGSETDYPLASDSYVEGMAAGPDGNIWFAASGAGKIGRLLLAQ